MLAIRRKLLRDLARMWVQALAIAAVMGCGVAMYVMSLATLDSLERTQRTYYERNRFAHVFARLERAPRRLVRRIAQIPGVAQVEPRIVVEVTLDVPGMTAPLSGRLISLPDHGRPRLNRLHLRRGRRLAPGARGEALISEAFAVAHRLRPGSAVSAVINGRLRRLRVVGIVLSPEYVLQIAGSDGLPDPKRFGVVWLREAELAAAFDLDGAFNDVCLALRRDANPREVIRRLDDLLAPFGGVGAYDRAEQVSHQFLHEEFRQLRAMGVMLPAIFLLVAAFLLNVVMTRQVNTQREQIAALKAFGYSDLEVGWHYAQLVLLIVFVGVLIGAAVGQWLGHGLTRLYSDFYRFPSMEFAAEGHVVLTGLVISAVAGLLGTLSAVRRAVSLPPAEAMRPEPPASYHASLAERWGLAALLPPAARMVLRHLERHPVKSSLSVLGIAMAVSVLVLGSFMVDAMDYLMEVQFERAQRHEITVTLVRPAAPRALGSIAHLPGVSRCEPFRALATRFVHGHRRRRVGIMGLPADSQLFCLIDTQERHIRLPPRGMVMSAKLAELLHVRRGERVTVEVLEGPRPVRQVKVEEIIDDYQGTGAYMRIDAVQRLSGEGQQVSGAFLAVDPSRQEALYRRLKATPAVAGVAVKSATLQSFRDTIAENMLKMQAFNIIFAVIIACGVVYNSARIALSERSRDLATMRVIGFTRAEISFVLLGELAVLTLAAIPVGLLIGYGLAALSVTGMESELFRIPLRIERVTYARAALVVLLAAAAAGLIVRRKLDRLDLVAVLKTRE